LLLVLQETRGASVLDWSRLRKTWRYYFYDILSVKNYHQRLTSR